MKRLLETDGRSHQRPACRWHLLCAGLAFVFQAGLTNFAPASAQTNSIDSAQIEAAGMSAARLKRLNQVLDKAVDDGDLQGAVLSVERDGKEVFSEAFGHLDLGRQRAMPVNAVFDLSTLTQPVTVAAAILWQEQGGWLLTDSLGQHLTPFARQRASLWDVMRQTDGLARAIDPLDREPGQRIRPSQRWTHSLDAALSMTGDTFIRQLASRVSPNAPGVVASTGFSFDLLGLALENSSQETLGTYFLRHLFIPLDMWDTGFNPPAGLETRLVIRDGGSATIEKEGLVDSPVRDPRDPVIFECGGACLTGTAADYRRFASMLLNGGQLGHQTVLSRLSVGMMTRHQLATTTDNRLPALIETDELRKAGLRSGLGLALVPQGVPLPLPLQAGDFGAWAPGGSFFWVSPSERLAVVMLAVLPKGRNSARLRQKVIGLIAQSIVK